MSATWPEKLYVIGNGFDRHHKINCGYNNFRDWLQENRPKIFNNMLRIYGECDGTWWSTFEENLTNFDRNKYPNMVGRTPFFRLQKELVELYGDEARDVIDQYELEEEEGVSNRFRLSEAIASFEMNRLKRDLIEAFGDWVYSLNLPDKSTIIEDLDVNAMFFTFNYTRTIEDLYGVNKGRILHIHGSVDNGVFVIGHGMTAEDMLQRDAENYAYSVDPTEDMGEDEARRQMFQVIAHELKKPVEEIIEKNIIHFKEISSIKKMIVLGFSYSDIDLPYLRKILEYTGLGIKVDLGWHTLGDKKKAEAFRLEMKLLHCKLVRF